MRIIDDEQATHNIAWLAHRRKFKLIAEIQTYVYITNL